jgi:hypothetical protein
VELCHSDKLTHCLSSCTTGVCGWLPRSIESTSAV